MRADITNVDRAAVYADYFMAAIAYGIVLSSSIFLVRKAVSTNETSDPARTITPATHFRKIVINQFNILLIVLGISIGSCLLLHGKLVEGAHDATRNRGLWMGQIFFYDLFKTSYSSYSYIRSCAIFQRSTAILRNIVYLFAVCSPFIFGGHFLLSILHATDVLGIQPFRIYGPIALAFLVFFDSALVASFVIFLVENDSSDSGTGVFKKLQKATMNQTESSHDARLTIIAQHGILGSLCMISGFVFIVLTQLVPSLNYYVNLLNSLGMICMEGTVGILFLMKVRLHACRAPYQHEEKMLP